MIPETLTFAGIKLATRTFLLIAGLVVMCLMAALIPSCLVKMRSERAQHKVEQGQGKAAVESGHDAINTASNVSDRQVEGEAIGRENERNIRNAQGSDAKAGNAATGAGLNSLCRRPAYRDSERCRLRGAAAR